MNREDLTTEEQLDTLSELDALHGEYIVDVVLDYSNTLEMAVDIFAQNTYVGEFGTERELAYQVVDDTGLLSGIDDTVARYFDYEQFGRDLFYSGDYWRINKDHRMYVFANE